MDLEAKLNTEFRAWLRAVILLTGLVTCLGAAARDTGTVRGQVADSVTGRALAGAIVRISSTDVAAVTGPEGRFLLQGVPAGSVSLEVSFLGYGTFIDTIEVIAGGSVLRNVRLGDATETMLVVGQASGQARALNEQRTARNLVNVVSSDFIGNFPDQNVAEALGRLPGVTIQRNRGEGRYASIRGLDAQLVSYSLDGMSMAAPRPDERAVLLDIIPTDVVDQLEVSKTLLPDQPADAIGGAINVVSSSPFDSGGQISRVKLQSNYSNLSNDWMPHVAGTLGGTFGEARTLGAIITLSYDERTLAADALWTDPWERAVDPLTGQESYLASRLDVQRYDLTRTRSGATANLEYRPSDDSRYMLRANYNLFTDDAVRHRSRIQMDEDGLVSLDDDSAVVNVGDIPDLGGTEIVQDVRDRYEELSVWGVNLSGENRFDDVSIDYQAGYSFADEHNVRRTMATYVLSGTAQTRYSDGRAIVPEIGFNPDGLDPTIPENYSFDGLDNRPSLTEESHWELGANARWEFDRTSLDYLKAGVRGRFKVKTADNGTLELVGSPEPLDDFAATNIGRGPNSFATGMPLIDPRLVSKERLRTYTFLPDPVDAVAGDWRGTEDVLAGYVMGSYLIGDLELIPGIRYEHTDYHTSGYAVDADTELATAVGQRNRYGSWLPGIHAIYRVSDDMILRASFTETLARPGFEQAAVSNVVDGDEISRGNPALMAASSRNYDLSADVYLPASLGSFSLALFYKDIDGFLFRRVFEETIDGQVFEVSTFENGEQGHVQGLELSYQQLLSFLPEPLNGLGVMSNVYWTDSEATLPETIDRTAPADLTIPYPRQSDLGANVALTYERGPVFLRIAATYRDKYLESVGDEPHGDLYWEEHLQWDFTSRITLTDRLSVFANLINLTNEPLRGRYDGSWRSGRYETYSWSAQLGVEIWR